MPNKLETPVKSPAGAAGETKAAETEEQVISKSLLSDKAILHHMVQGTVVIEPFNMANLNTSSYDVTLGEYYFREAPPEAGMTIFNPYCATMVNRVWGKPHEAEYAEDFTQRTGIKLENIHPRDRIIWLQPGETILGHTNEFIGGQGGVTTMMKARSSMGRTFIEVCKCAGWGDCGYVSRWTMEITNNSRSYSIPLVVGRRIAQIVFFDTDGTLENRSYAQGGKYQSTTDFAELKKGWTPLTCLPRMYLDREVKAGAYEFPSDKDIVPSKEAALAALKEFSSSSSTSASSASASSSSSTVPSGSLAASFAAAATSN